MVVQFRQDPSLGPGKLGIAHREGWVAYCLEGFVFIKRFGFADGKAYPDGGMNFETFANEEILELESIGPLVTLCPDESTSHEETWSLHRDIPACSSEDEIDRHIRPLSEL